MNEAEIIVIIGLLSIIAVIVFIFGFIFLGWGRNNKWHRTSKNGWTTEEFIRNEE